MEAFGPYRLIRHLATGGMGELHLAVRPGAAGFSKLLVVKRIRAALASDSNFTRSFLDEGRVAALIDHPNIVQIYDMDEVDGVFYMAMEYVAGQDLGALLGQVGLLDLSITLHVMGCLCEGLRYAHDALGPDGRPLGLVHRDINPKNVLISFNGVAKLADFGIAKAQLQDREQTRTGVIKGKFGYLAPEQAGGTTIDRRCDIYSLGLLLFEMTTGEPAVEGDNDQAKLFAALDGRIRRPTDLDPAYPEELQRIYERATALNPQDRFTTVGELHQRLLEFQMSQRLTPKARDLGQLLRRAFPEAWREHQRESRLEGPLQVTASVDRAPREARPPQPPAPLQPLSSFDGAEADLVDEEAPTDIHVSGLPGTFDAGPGEPESELPPLPDDWFRALEQAADAVEGERPDTLPAPIDLRSFAPPLAVPTPTVQDLIRPPEPPPLPEDAGVETDEGGEEDDLDIEGDGGTMQSAFEGGRMRSLLEIESESDDGRPDASDPRLPASSAEQAALRRLEQELELHDPPPVSNSAARGRGGGLRITLVVLLLVVIAGAAGAVYLFYLREPPLDPTGLLAAVTGARDAATGPAVRPLPPVALDARPASVAAEAGAGVDAHRDATPPTATPTPRTLDAATPPDARRAPVVVTSAPDAAAPARPAGITGRLKLSVSPPVAVTLRGQALGRTPLNVELPAGKHLLILRDPDLGISMPRGVKIEPDQTTVASWELRKGVLEVKAPGTTEVLVNGVRRGKTPLSLELYQGVYKVQLQGVWPEPRRVVVRPEATTTVQQRASAPSTAPVTSP